MYKTPTHAHVEWKSACVGVLYIIVRNLFELSIIYSITDSIYWHGTGKISSFLNRPLQDAQGLAPDISLITLFCSLKTLQLSVALPQNIIPYLMTE